VDLLITGVDLFTAIGATAETTYFSVRAGLSRFTETGAVNRLGAPRIAAVLPGAMHRRDPERLPLLAAESAGRALDDAGIETARSVGVALCLPGPPRPDAVSTLDASWTSPFEETFAARRIVPHVRAFCEGAASIALALQDALARLNRGDEDAALIGGADSWLPLQLLRWLEERRRLKIGEHLDGLMAGEAAGFLVLESPGRRVGSKPALAVLKAASLAREPGHFESNEPCLSFGYTEAVRSALTAVDPGRAPRVLLSDLNGESYKAKEWAVAELRTLPQGLTSHLHPADCFGDIGSVAGVVQLGLAAIGLSRKEWLAPAVIAAGADGAARAVVVVDMPGASGGLEPDLAAPLRTTAARPIAGALSSALVADHLEEMGFLRLQRRLAEKRSAERWCDRDAHDRRHAWHLLALTALVPDAQRTLVAMGTDAGRPPEDRAAAVTSLALAGSSAMYDAIFGMLKQRADVVVLAEAFSDLPERAREALRRRVGEYADPRMEQLVARLLGDHEDEERLVATVERASSLEARQAAAVALIERGSDAIGWLLDSATLVGTLPPETVALAAARATRRDAFDLSRRVAKNDMTPRLLAALGATGHREAIEILLQFVDDASAERADAAAGALAALSGVDLIEPAGEEDAGNEAWSRSAERWRSALLQVPSPRQVSERIVRGRAWSLEWAKEWLVDPQGRNGVRRVLATALGKDWAGHSVTSYYWLQRRTAAAPAP
jgi:3-oxoacyl-[acyl-carrier-protein] synthase-1